VLTVTALDLEKWAETIPAKAEFPWLLRRLVWATCSEIWKLDFRGGHHVYLRGFDGLVDCGRGNHIVPAGVSGWELTTDKNVTKKANEDYNKRTLNPRGLDKRKSSFIFATPCSWPAGRDWEQEKKATKQWGDVRVVLSDDLEMWMDEVPWIATEFARLCLGKEIAGLRTIEMIWNAYSNVPTPSGDHLGPEFVVGGRKHIQDQLLNWMASEILGGDKRIIRISASSGREALDFLAAGIQSAAETVYAKLASRVFVLDDVASAQSLRGVSANHTIIGTGDVIPHIIELSRKTNCKVIIFHARSKPAPSPLPWIDGIELEPLAKSEMIRAVIDLGYPPEQAGQLCEEHSFDYERIRRFVFLC
jgi:hypothetical protein